MKNHPKSELFYNSAAFFQMATTEPFENERTVLFLAQGPQTMKANRVPQAVEFTIVTLDQASIQKASSLPEQTNEVDRTGALDVAASLQQFRDRLREQGIQTTRTFTTRARLINGN